MRVTSTRRAILAFACALSGCAGLIGIETTTDDAPGGIGSDASTDDRDGRVDGNGEADGPISDADAGNPCPGVRGPKMVRLDAGFCIDSTEVTRSDYAAFMASDASLATGSQPTECSFNTTFAPAGWPYAPDADLAIPAGVNWCDALAYCQWAGKRLCGSRADGGFITVTQGSDPGFSEWAAACSHDGMRTYPYGSTYQSKSCNGKDFDAGRTLPVATLPLCQGGDPGIFDMSGNAWEWDLSCVLDDAGRAQQCGQRGGSYADNSGLLPCALTNYQDLALIQESAGFRCCAR